MEFLSSDEGRKINRILARCMSFNYFLPSTVLPVFSKQSETSFRVYFHINDATLSRLSDFPNFSPFKITMLA